MLRKRENIEMKRDIIFTELVCMLRKRENIEMKRDIFYK